MNKKLYTINLIGLILLTSSILFGQGIPVRDTLSMDPGYANDIFYSFKNGEVLSASRDTWDIAFFTPRFSAGIIINEGMGAALYTYPNGDINDWATLDTNGMSGWKLLNNSPEFWEEGAFNVNALGHPDYGWGIYNQVDHHVYGDSLYVIKTASGYKKLMIEEKKSIVNIYVFKFANLDGSDEKMVELDVAPFETKQFIYYSLENNEAIDREPPKDSWDLQFTKYIDLVPDNEGDFSPYLVTGATNNIGAFANNFYPAQSNFSDWGAKPFDTTKNAIGYDWKSYDFAANEWALKDSNYYFVNTVDGDIYRLQFHSWEGSMTGKFVLDKWLISLADIDEEPVLNDRFSVYPNPAQSQFTITSNTLVNVDCQLLIMDQAGRMIYQQNLSANNLNEGVKINSPGLKKGLYLVTIKTSEHSYTQKLIIN